MGTHLSCGAGTAYHRLRQLRHTLHMHPELSGDERETAGVIAAYLKALGLPTETGIGGHGVVAVLATGRPGPTIAYRADMDALPLQETSDHAYTSMMLGVSHACGHDVHMTIALGVAEQLIENVDELQGRVMFVFQPAEESLDGARSMLEDGLFERATPDAMLALHAFPLPVGHVGVARGPCLAGMEEFRVRFYTPAGDREALIDEAIRRLEALSTEQAPTDVDTLAPVIRRMRAGAPSLSRAVFISGWPATPGSVSQTHILGLVSLPDEASRAPMRDSIEATLGECTASFGASFDLDVTFSSPPLHNDRALVERIVPAMQQALELGAVQVYDAPYPFAHEDFARYAEKVPAALLWLGTQNLEKGIPSVLHTPDYDVDEASLEIGVRAMAAAISDLLRS